jgi:hypothetical protein
VGIAVKLRRNWQHFVVASVLFPGIDPGVDRHLLRRGLNTDVAFCRKLATMPPNEQADFLELHEVDPKDAELWATLPPWKRSVRRGTSSDRAAWSFLVNLWPCFDHERDHRASGHVIACMSGILRTVTPANGNLALLLAGYGEELKSQNRLPAGREIPPWDPRATAVQTTPTVGVWPGKAAEA